MKTTILIFILLLTFNASAQDDKSSAGPKPPANFQDDGCTWFPDGNYVDCCVAHDKAYYSGGSWQKRLSADNKLFTCVAKKKGWYQPLIAPIMWAGVRVFGVSFLPTDFRWGFGKNKLKKSPNSQKRKTSEKKSAEKNNKTPAGTQ